MLHRGRMVLTLCGQTSRRSMRDGSRGFGTQGDAQYREPAEDCTGVESDWRAELIPQKTSKQASDKYGKPTRQVE